MTEKEKLERTYKELLEEKIINHLAVGKSLPIRQAMDIYYRSRLSQQTNDGSYGIGEYGLQVSGAGSDRE